MRKKKMRRLILFLAFLSLLPVQVTFAVKYSDLLIVRRIRQVSAIPAQSLLQPEERVKLAQELYETYKFGPDRFSEEVEKLKSEIATAKEKLFLEQILEQIIDAVELRANLSGEAEGFVYGSEERKAELESALERISGNPNYEFYTSGEYSYTDDAKKANEVFFNSAVYLGIPYEAVVRGIIGLEAYKVELSDGRSSEFEPYAEMIRKIKQGNPEYTLIVGGTGSEIAIASINKLQELVASGAIKKIIDEEGLQKLRDLGVEGFVTVVEPPWDDGGSTRARIEYIKKGNTKKGRAEMGWTPAVGDEARARGSLASKDIKTLLSYRIYKTPTDLSNNTGIGLSDHLYEDFTKWAAENIESLLKNKKLDFTEHSPEYIFFLSNMLNAARIMDEVFSPEENLGAALKNDFTLAMRLQKGGSFRKRPDGEINWQKFRDETILLNIAQNIKRGHVTLNSFEHGVLYIRLNDENLSFRLMEGSHNETFAVGFYNDFPVVLVNGRLQSPYSASAITVIEWAKRSQIKRYGDTEDIENFDFAKALEENYDVIKAFSQEAGLNLNLVDTLKKQGKSWDEIGEVLKSAYAYTEYEPIKIALDSFDKSSEKFELRVKVVAGDIEVKIDDGDYASINSLRQEITNGPSESVERQIGGRIFELSEGTLVVQQTYITENFHQAKIKEFGLIGKEFALTSNPEADNDILTTGKMVIVGPGSFYTSIMQNLIANADELYKLGKAEKHPPRVFIFNPYYDNETAGYSIQDMVEMINNVLERHHMVKENGDPIEFKDLFDYVILSMPDTWVIANQLLRIQDPSQLAGLKFEEEFNKNGVDLSDLRKVIEDNTLRATQKKLEELEERLQAGEITRKQVIEEIGKFLTLIASDMDKSKEAEDYAKKREDPAAFSKAAKLARGPIIPDNDAIDYLKDLLGDDRVKVASIVSVVLKEERKAGLPKFDEGAGYDPELLAYVLAEILNQQP